jgi:hypothetical protein
VRSGCHGCAELTDNMPCNSAWMSPQQRVELIVRIRRAGFCERCALALEE